MNYSNLPKPQSSPTRQLPKSALFYHEKLEVYKQELQFIKWVTPIIEEAAKSPVGRPREVCDQLDRASISAVLNTAEGNGKRQRQVRAKFFDDARGSGTECAACLDVLVAKGIFSDDRVLQGKAMLLEIVCMLSALVERFDESGGGLREDVVEYKVNSDIEAGVGKARKQRKRK